MLGRFNLWSTPEKEPTRLEKFKESASFMPIIEELRTHHQKLSAEAESSHADVLVHHKFAILNEIAKAMDEPIQSFNRENSYDDPEAEMQAVSCLIENLSKSLFRIFKDNGNDRVLNAERDEYRHLADGTIRTATFAGLVTTGAFISAPVSVTAIGAFLLTKRVANTVENAVGFEREKTTSASIVTRLMAALKTAKIKVDENYNEHHKNLLKEQSHDFVMLG